MKEVLRSRSCSSLKEVRIFEWNVCNHCPRIIDRNNTTSTIPGFEIDSSVIYLKREKKKYEVEVLYMMHVMEPVGS